MRRKRRGRKKYVLIPAVILAGIVIFLRIWITPRMEQLVVTQASNTMSALVNDIVNAHIASGSIDYDKMVLLEKDTDGNITAVKTNIRELNRLKTEILTQMNLQIEDISVDELSVPIGNFFLPELFSGKGFRIPVRILSVSTSDADFENRFYEAGINQTLHQIRMNIRIGLSVWTPSGTSKTQVDTQVAVAETIIVGKVPNSYLQIGKQEEIKEEGKTP